MPTKKITRKAAEKKTEDLSKPARVNMANPTPVKDLTEISEGVSNSRFVSTQSSKCGVVQATR